MLDLSSACIASKLCRSSGLRRGSGRNSAGAGGGRWAVVERSAPAAFPVAAPGGHPAQLPCLDHTCQRHHPSARTLDARGPQAQLAGKVRGVCEGGGHVSALHHARLPAHGAQAGGAEACGGGGHGERGGSRARLGLHARRGNRKGVRGRLAHVAGTPYPGCCPCQRAASWPAPPHHTHTHRTLTTAVPASWMRAMRARAASSPSARRGVAADSTGRIVMPVGAGWRAGRGNPTL